MHDINHSMREFQIVWNVDVCVVPSHVPFRWRVTLVGEFNYWPLLTPSWENNFRYLRYTWEWDAFEALEAKKWPELVLFLYFVKIWVEDPVFFFFFFFVTCN